MEGTTSISALPNDNKSKQIVLEKKEIQQPGSSSQSTNQVVSNTPPIQQNYSPQMQQNMSMPMQQNNNHNPGLTKDDISQIVAGIKEAGALNLTGLPSRDIPMTTTNITQDEQVKPNFIPKDGKYDYINNDDTLNSIMKERNEKKMKRENIDYVYNEMNVSVFIMVLFFLFNLPFINNVMMSFLPKLFSNDGSIKVQGLMLKTACFGGLYYLSFKLTNYLTNL